MDLKEILSKLDLDIPEKLPQGSKGKLAAQIGIARKNFIEILKGEFGDNERVTQVLSACIEELRGKGTEHLELANMLEEVIAMKQESVGSH